MITKEQKINIYVVTTIQKLKQTNQTSISIQTISKIYQVKKQIVQYTHIIRKTNTLNIAWEYNNPDNLMQKYENWND